jgi:hypothetical protein
MVSSIKAVFLDVVSSSLVEIYDSLDVERSRFLRNIDILNW